MLLCLRPTALKSALFILALCPPALHAGEIEEATIKVIANDGSSGSGTVCFRENDLYIAATCYHVVEQNRTVNIVIHDRDGDPVKQVAGYVVIRGDNYRDFALVAFNHCSRLPCFPIARYEPNNGFWAKYCGVGVGSPTDYTVWVHDRDSQDWIANKHGLVNGDSGSGLVHGGRIIGVSRARVSQIGYWTRLRHIHDVLDDGDWEGLIGRTHR